MHSLTLGDGGCLLIVGGEMTHREFLIWLKPRLDSARATGLPRDAVLAIREQLKQLRGAGALQPFASKLHNLTCLHSTLDVELVAELADDLRSELAPQREKTFVLSAGQDEE